MIKKALKGAKHPKTDFMAVRLEQEFDARLGKARDLAEDGSLSEASKEIAAILADEKSTEDQKKQAASMQSAIDAQVKVLAEQAEKFVKARDVERAIQVLDSLARELGSTEAGAKAKKRLDEVNADPKLKAELEAVKALQRLKDQIRPLKRDKSGPKIEEFVKKYKGTKAAERAGLLLQTIKTKN